MSAKYSLGRWFNLGRVANLFSRSRVDREIGDELESHIAMRIEDNVAAGMTESEARRDALVRFGNVTAAKERVTGADVALGVEGFWFDVRYAGRQLRRSPWFALTAVVTLALAIGANAVVFSILNAFLLRPLNVAHPENLYAIFHGGDAGESYPDYLDLRDRNHSFESLAAYSVAEAVLDTGRDPVRAWIYEISGNYFETLGVEPYLGRFISAADERGANSAPYVVLTYPYWKNRFQADRTIVGRVVMVNKRPYTVLGVTPEGFHGTLLFFNPDFFVPLVNKQQIDDADKLDERDKTAVFMTIGHLKAGVTEAQAAADLNVTAKYLMTTYPKIEGKLDFVLGSPNLYGDYLGRPVKAFMTGLMLLSGLILLAACANLGSLFAARAADRSREVALRLALGSSRRRILRSLFTEAVLISLVGGAVGLAGSVVLLRGLSVWRPIERWPIHLGVEPDGTVYGVAVMLTLASGLLFGAVPVRQVLRTNPYEMVKAGMAGAAARRRRITAQDVLLVMQIAVCAVLVTSSMAAVRGLVHTLHGGFGFETTSRMLLDTDLTMAGYSGQQVPAMQERMMRAIESVGGVESVGLADNVPLGDGSADTNVFSDATTDLKPANAVADPYVFKVSTGYFEAAGTQLVAGRGFTKHDDKNSPHVAVVSRFFARKLFGVEGKALGAHFKLPDGTRVEVVGVAEDGKYASLNEEISPAIFLSILQAPSNSFYLLVKSGRDPEQLGAAIRSKLRELDPGLPVQIQTRYVGMDAHFFGPRMATISLGVLGAMGAMLSITGIFGLAAFTVSKRLRELGIRMALGAQRRQVLQAALGRAFKLLAIGSGLGLGLGLVASKVLAYLVNEASARDPLVLAGVVLAMAGLGMLATGIPAYRALSVDPMRLLREE